MTNLDDVRFFGRTKCILSHPIRVRRKVKVGLFRSRIEEVYVCLFFYVKDWRTIEFVTKEDISDIFPPEDLLSGRGVRHGSLFQTTDGIYEFDAATFASYTRDYGVTPQEISAALADYRARLKTEAEEAARKRAEQESERQSNLDWLNRSI